jgi:hypothetical protein
MPTYNLSPSNYQNNNLFPKILTNTTNFSDIKCTPVQPKMSNPFSNPILKPTIMPM